jgi:two-component system, chemotaxis family, chemotaxis protein CheY
MDTTILIVDDSKMQIHLMEKIMKDLGYTCIESALNVDEAKKVLAEKKIDVIFSDWHMPNGSGLDLVKYVRATKDTASIPFLMVTTEHEKSNIFEAVRAGCQNYIFKPVSKDTIKKKLYDLVKTYPSINPPHEAL